MELHGFHKLTLLDYPGYMACTIFTGHCNFRCPFCQNSSLVLNPSSQPLLPEEEVLSVLEKRRGILEGVCLTGGEPTLQPDLERFLRRIRDMGYRIKLDTNGFLPDVLSHLMQEGLLDYIAMDIKNSRARYPETAGIPGLPLEPVERSIRLLMQDAPSLGIEYEFRTTVVREFHTLQDLREAGEWIQGAEAWYLQAFQDSGDLIGTGLTGYDADSLHTMAELIRPYAALTGLRGVD